MLNALNTEAHKGLCMHIQQDAFMGVKRQLFDPAVQAGVFDFVLVI